ncbi:MAG: hypothetical protein U9N61_00110 [Euryarchaeota archaeon]|nr:hypothetical protein [Euryarchaeota archaeon]
MSYYMQFIDIYLPFNPKHKPAIGTKGFYLFWAFDDDCVVPQDNGGFNWSDEFISDLQRLATQGVTGDVTLLGEEGEYSKYVLKGDTIEEHDGKTTFSEEPDVIHYAEELGGKKKE